MTTRGQPEGHRPPTTLLTPEMQAFKARLAARRVARDRLSDLDDESLWEGQDDHLTLTEAGASLARSAGLTVDVDAYGCVFVREMA